MGENKMKVQQLSINKLNWHTEKRRVKDLIPYERNPRTLTDVRANNLKASVKKYNFVEIPVIDTDNKILAGHQRMKIMILLGRGEEEIEVRVPNRKLTKKEFEEYNLRSNVSIGEWDFEMLKELDISLLLDVGFTNSDLSHIWDENLSVEEDEFNINEAIAKIKTPRTKPGDLIYLGENRLICGDSLDLSIVGRLVGDKKISMLNFDPPYNINMDYVSGIGTKGKYGSLKVNDRKTKEEYRSFLKTALKNGLNYSYPDCHIFCWCDQSYIGLLQSLYEELGIENRRVCLWIKNNQNPTPQVAFNKAYEACAYGTLGNPYIAPTVTNLNEILNQEIGTGNRLPDDIMDLFNIWLVKRDNSVEYEHPSQKPTTLYEKSLRRCSKAGDIVLDLFAGSGPLMSACEQLKRRAFMSELDPVFCDVIVARYTQLTGKEAVYENAKR